MSDDQYVIAAHIKGPVAAREEAAASSKVEALFNDHEATIPESALFVFDVTAQEFLNLSVVVGKKGGSIEVLSSTVWFSRAQFEAASDAAEALFEG